MNHAATFHVSRPLPGIGITALALSLQAGVMADILTVDPSGPADYASIGEAVGNAAFGDVVLLAPGIYRDTDGDGFVVAITDKDLTIRSTDGAEATFIEYAVHDEGVTLGRGLFFSNDTFGMIPSVVIEGVTIRPDSSADPAAPVSTAAAVETRDISLSFRDCRFEGNRGPSYILGLSFREQIGLTFTRCAFEDNTDMDLRGLRGYFTDCTFERNGQVYGAASTTGPTTWRPDLGIEGCSFSEQGRSVTVFGRGDLTIDDCTFSGGQGQSAVNVMFESHATIRNSRFLTSRNTAVSINEAALVMTECLLEGHPDSDQFLLETGGDACEECGDEYHIVVERTDFRSSPGGAVDISSRVESRAFSMLLKSCSFTNNSSAATGGAIKIENSYVDIDRCTFSENESGVDGHAIAMQDDESGDRWGAVRIMNSTFTQNGSGGAGNTVYNSLHNLVSCFGNKFCGDAGDPLGGSAMSVWDNLLAGACWADFPNPRGITALEGSPALKVVTVAGPDSDSDLAFGGTSDTAFAQSSFHSFPFQADASANATIHESTPTEHGIEYAIQTGGHLVANAGGEDFPIAAEAQVRFTTTLQVSARETQILEIDLFSQDGTDLGNEWSSLTTGSEVRSAGGVVLAPTDADPAAGYWRYELPAGGNYSIDAAIECSSEAIASGFGSVNKFMDEAIQLHIEFHLPGAGGEDDDEDEEETEDEDLNQDGKINGADLAAILQFWGTQDPAHDLNGDGEVNGGDFALVLGAWRP